MKDKETEILKKVAHDDGIRVPADYFEDFANRMESSLPHQDWEDADYAKKIAPRSFWQKSRPYVYLAAMFMGIWCMLQMFNLMKSKEDVMTVGDNPVLTAALNNDSFMMDYYVEDVDEWDLMENLYNEGISVTSLQ